MRQRYDEYLRNANIFGKKLWYHTIMPPKGTWRTYNEGIKNSNEEMRFAKIGREECYFFSYHSFST